MNNKMIWTPPTNLNAPIPPKGYEYRGQDGKQLDQKIKEKN
jgi:hypothetical protein